jgi:hypothetical protein
MAKRSFQPPTVRPCIESGDEVVWKERSAMEYGPITASRSNFSPGMVPGGPLNKRSIEQ